MAAESVTSELSEVQVSAVAAHLRSVGVMPAGPLTATLIAGGRSNLTYRLDDAECSWVLRMPPRQGRTASAHDVAREFRVTSALMGTDVPVPQAVALCEDPSIVGSPFAVSRFVAGRTLQSAVDLDDVHDDSLLAITSRLVETLASLHEVDYVAIGLERFGPGEGYAMRQLKRWTSQWEVVGELRLQSLARALSDRLSIEVPKQESTVIIHGDFRIDNTLLNLLEEPSVAAVIDWELSTIGDPVADVAMMCAYRHSAFDLIVGAPSAWASPRLPAPDVLAAAYEGAGGATLHHWSFHLALAYFKIGVIAAGIQHRNRAGSGVGSGFDTAGDSVEEFFLAGLAAIEDTA